jgi:hypothetical protein
MSFPGNPGREGGYACCTKCWKSTIGVDQVSICSGADRLEEGVECEVRILHFQSIEIVAMSDIVYLPD